VEALEKKRAAGASKAAVPPNKRLCGRIRLSLNQTFKETAMSKFSKMKLSAMAAATLMSFTFLAPPAEAHACNGAGTITIRKIGNEYWYFQGGKVCGKFGAT
jgi:hypothetical protein